MMLRRWFRGLILLIAVMTLLAGCAELEGVLPDKHTLTVVVEGIGNANPPVGEHEFGRNTFVELESYRQSFAWSFKEWDGEVHAPESAETVIFLNTNKTVVAVFERELSREIYDREEIRGHWSRMSDEVLAYDDIVRNEVYFYRTAADYSGKLIVHHKDYDEESGWKFSFITFSDNGEVVHARDAVILPAGQYFDLDTGEASFVRTDGSDFRLRVVSPDDESFRPENEAAFWRYGDL